MMNIDETVVLCVGVFFGVFWTTLGLLHLIRWIRNN
jgi:hypothetical protein